MPPKKRTYKKKVTAKTSKKLAKVVNKLIKAHERRTVETKQAHKVSSDGTEISHNNFITLDSNVLSTTQGVQDNMIGTTNARIGDQITLKGVKMKMMVELNERYSDVTFRLLIVRCAKGDSPTRSTLFTGLAGNKMLDNINTERYKVLAQRFFKIKAPNTTATTSTGTNSQVGTTLPPSDAGIYYASTFPAPLSRATKIVKLWIPGAKFSRYGKITYENNSNQVKFFDYRVVLYAYSNYNTFQDVWNVGRCNEYICSMYFTDQ